MKFSILRSAFLFVVLPMVTPLGAQNATPEDEQAPKGRLAWMVHTAMPDGVKNPIKVLSGKELVEVTLSKRAPSEPLKIPADGVLRIVEKIEPAPEDPEKAYRTLGQAMVPKEINKALLILSPAPKNASGVLFTIQIQDLASFKGGATMYINSTNTKVGVEWGKDNPVVIESGKFKIQEFPSLTGATSTPIRYSFYHPEKEEWIVLSASTIAIYPTRREICIFSWDPRFKRIDYHGITCPLEPAD